MTAADFHIVERSGDCVTIAPKDGNPAIVFSADEETKLIQDLVKEFGPSVIRVDIRKASPPS